MGSRDFGLPLTLDRFDDFPPREHLDFEVFCNRTPAIRECPLALGAIFSCCSYCIGVSME